MVRDFGAGLTADELIGMQAWHIARLDLPRGDVFNCAQKAAQVLTRNGAEAYLLNELWADGHSVWLNPQNKKPAVVTPGGQVIQEKRRG